MNFLLINQNQNQNRLVAAALNTKCLVFLEKTADLIGSAGVGSRSSGFLHTSGRFRDSELFAVAKDF